MKNKEEFVIFSNRVARDLIRKGFKIIDIKDNHKHKNKNVFLFRNSKELREYLINNHNIQ